MVYFYPLKRGRAFIADYPVSREEFVARVRNGCIQDCLNFMNVHRGDCFLIEAGTMYAMGQAV